MRTLATLALLVALNGCQWGPPPRIPYVDGTTYVTPDGHRTLIDGQEKLGVSAVLPYADGLLVADTRWFEGSVGLAYVHDGERSTLGPCSTSGGKPNADQTEVAWLTTGCPEASLIADTVVHVADADGSDGWSRKLPQQSLLFVAGFVGKAVVVAGWRDPVRLVPETGPVTVVPHLRHAVATHGTLVAGERSVVDSASGRLLWSAPHTYLASFSPNGRLILGSESGVPAVLDARTGAVRVTLPKRLDRLTWEDNGHLLAVTWGNRSEVIVRIALHGPTELVGRVGHLAPGFSYRYVFETQP